MSWLDRFLLWLASGALRRQLERIAHEKDDLLVGDHENSDCGFELLHQIGADE